MFAPEASTNGELVESATHELKCGFGTLTIQTLQFLKQWTGLWSTFEHNRPCWPSSAWSGVGTWSDSPTWDGVPGSQSLEFRSALRRRFETRTTVGVGWTQIDGFTGAGRVPRILLSGGRDWNERFEFDGTLSSNWTSETLNGTTIANLTDEVPVGPVVTVGLSHLSDMAWPDDFTTDRTTKLLKEVGLLQYIEENVNDTIDPADYDGSVISAPLASEDRPYLLDPGRYESYDPDARVAEFPAPLLGSDGTHNLSLPDAWSGWHFISGDLGTNGYHDMNYAWTRIHCHRARLMVPVSTGSRPYFLALARIKNPVPFIGMSGYGTYATTPAEQLGAVQIIERGTLMPLQPLEIKTPNEYFPDQADSFNTFIECEGSLSYGTIVFAIVGETPEAWGARVGIDVGTSGSDAERSGQG